MSASYFRLKAAQSYRRARLGARENYEAFAALAREFKAKAKKAAVRLARMRGAALRKQESERQDAYRDRRE
jgi:hypothetical protein